MKSTRICFVCNGSGGHDGGNCPQCGGDGVLTEFEHADLETKLDSIIAEQASQREDLTVALTQIWNKVKDL